MERTFLFTLGNKANERTGEENGHGGGGESRDVERTVADALSWT